MSNFFGVDSVILDLRSMDSSHIEGMTKDEFEFDICTRISKPVPVEGTLTGNGQVLLIGGDEFQKKIEVVMLLGLSKVATSYI